MKVNGRRWRQKGKDRRKYGCALADKKNDKKHTGTHVVLDKEIRRSFGGKRWEKDNAPENIWTQQYFFTLQVV